MRTRILAALAVTMLGVLAAATPASASPAPAPSPTVTTSPTPTPTADPCLFAPTLEPVPEAKAPTLTKQRMPHLPLPVECFVVFVDNCDGSISVTLLNPIKHLVIKYRLSGFDVTHSIAFGESETFTVPGPSVRVFAVDDDGDEQITIARHRWHQPEGCTTPGPTPVPSPSGTFLPNPGNPGVLPETGQSLSTEIAVAKWTVSALALIGVGSLVVWLVRRRRQAA